MLSIWWIKPHRFTLIPDSSSAELVTDFADVFKDELGVLKGVEATIAVEESALPCFHKPQPVPFALKDKVEQQLQAQVDEGELVPVDSSDWSTPIVVVHKKDGKGWWT